MSSSQSFWSQPFRYAIPPQPKPPVRHSIAGGAFQVVNVNCSVQWRKALVSAPRLVPLSVLKWTSGEGPHPFLLSLSSRSNHRIPVYVFVPSEQLDRKSAHKLPVVVDFHGGGFVLGTCMEQAPFCAKLARELGAVVLTVDYRMGPIDTFPAAIEDGEDVLDAVIKPGAPGFAELRKAVAHRLHHDWDKAVKSSKHSKAGDIAMPFPNVELDPTRVAVAGFSSGGNLALNLALSVGPPQIEKAWPSRFPSDYPNPIPLLLFYPSFDCRQLPSERTRPPKLTASPKFLAELDDTLMPTYLPRSQASHPRASPGLAPVKFNTEYGGAGGLHPKATMFLVLPELDSLSEQSEIWVKKVEEEGRNDDLVVERYEGMKHGWTQMPESWLSEEEDQTRIESFTKAVAFTKSAWSCD
jgi:acetyl esterase/lipase